MLRFPLGRILAFFVLAFAHQDVPACQTETTSKAAEGIQAAASDSASNADADQAAETKTERLRIAIYDHSDGSAKAPKALRRILTEESGFECVKVTPEDIQKDGLKDCHALIMPGGSGSLQAKKLGETGRRNIQQFVTSGGGYVGICAGSYLASSDYEWSLHLLNAKVFDRAHWARGTGEVTIKLTTEGKQFLSEDKEELPVYYGQGPLLIPDTKPDLPAFEPLAAYATEIAKKGAPTGVMIGTTAIARAPYGKGRVICFSPHPEVSGGPNHLISAGVRWAAGTDAARTDKDTK
ncbi:MAG: biofilm PGA synthesis protein PgaC [Planctomycetaceae bacterium]|nr:biofilm PGA synthesis protein PgaC [Planctomycetaceae bacterium]